MVRGTTPTLTFKLPFEAERLTKLSIAFVQEDEMVLEKELRDCTMEGEKILLPLTEEDTLALKKGQRVLHLQLRCGIGDKRLASQVITVPVGQILKEGVL